MKGFLRRLFFVFISPLIFLYLLLAHLSQPFLWFFGWLFYGDAWKWWTEYPNDLRPIWMDRFENWIGWH